MKNDKFAILLHRENGNQLVEYIMAILGEVTNKTYVCQGERISISVSVGMCLMIEEDIISKLKIALRAAKQEKITFVLYSKKIDCVNNKKQNIQKTQAIQEALQSNKVRLHYQPIVDAKTLKINKYEALVRIYAANGNLLYPDDFLKLSRKAKLYDEITKAVINEAFFTLTTTQVKISINLTMRDILTHKTKKYLLDQIRKHGKGVGSRLTLEMVETDEIKDYELFNAFVSEVREFNVSIAIDDFGIAYSNFFHLVNMDFDILKIDGHFVKNMHDKKNRTIIELVVLYARRMDKKTIAEYVETEADKKELTEMGVDYFQGYYFGKPSKQLQK